MIAPAALLSNFSVTIATRARDEGPVVALDGVNLHVPAGKVTALVGESGCGKSLVARALCGLLPPGATASGELRIGDSAVGHSDERSWRRIRGRTVGLVPQSPATSFTPVRTLGAQLRETIATLSGSKTAEELLSCVQLPLDALRLFPHQLSGGMAQRAAIAAAIAGAPALLVADEPTSALDPELAGLVWTLLRAIADDGSAVLVITHDLKSLIRSKVWNSIAVMGSGRVVVQDSPTNLLASQHHYVAKLFVGVTP